MNKINKRKVILLISLVMLLYSNAYTQDIFQENLKDWDAYGDAKWQYSGDEFVAEVKDGAGFVMTKQSYENFILELEFKPDSTINSGVFIRCQDKDINYSECYELNIWDLHPDQNNRTGAIVMRTVPLAIVETMNKWNTYRIKAKKNHIQVWVNDTLTADIIDKEGLISGYIGLQAMGTGKIKFRNINIKNLKID